MRDTDDEMVLESALNGLADAIITHNVLDFVIASSQFGLRVLKPSEFLAEILR